MVDKSESRPALSDAGAIQAHQTRYRDMYVPFLVQLNPLSTDVHDRARTALYRQMYCHPTRALRVGMPQRLKKGLKHHASRSYACRALHKYPSIAQLVERELLAKLVQMPPDSSMVGALAL